MALEPVRLDDLNWKDMVEAVRRRIPAASDGKWTLHAPVDPGVTLVELFAWQFEQRLYWMDQTTDSFTRAALALLGVRPMPTRCARTVMRLATDAFRVAPRGTELSLIGSMPPVVFSTRTAVAVLPVDRVRIRLGEEDRTRDLEQGRVFRLFPADGGAASIDIGFELNTALPAEAAGKWFNLLVQLRAPSSLAPQWSPEATHGVPPPAQITWSYRGGTGAQVRIVEQDLEDGTGGLRRSGVVRIRIPPDWQPEGRAGSGQDKLFSIRLQTDPASYTYPPRLVALVPNAVLARHARRTRLYCLTRRPSEWLPLPGNVIALDELPRDMPDKDIPPIEHLVALWLLERDGGWHRWRPTADLYRYGPADRVFVVDRQKSLLGFGDGLTGRLAVLAFVGEGQPNIKLCYLVGGGLEGLVGASPKGLPPNWEGPNGLTAVSLVASEGGAEAETMAEARQRAAATLRRRDRAITKSDYEEIARAVPGVAVRRAHAAVGYHPGNPCVPVAGAVTVFIVPDAPREERDVDAVESAYVAAPLPDPGVLAAVEVRLQDARLVASEVFVRAPRYRPVAVRVALQGAPADPQRLRMQLEDRLRRFLDPLLGGTNGAGWPFGEPLRPSVMLREAQTAAGDEANVTEVAIGIDGNEPDESCREVPIGAHDLVWLQRVAVEPAPGASTGRGLR